MRSKNGRVFLYRIFAIFAVSICSVASAADKALDQADANGWIIVDMKKEWKQIFPAK